METEVVSIAVERGVRGEEGGGRGGELRRKTKGRAAWTKKLEPEAAFQLSPIRPKTSPKDP